MLSGGKYLPLINTVERTLRAVNTKVLISAPNSPETVLFERLGNVIEVSLAFDQNMNPFVAFVEGIEESNTAWFWWFDTVVQQQIFTQLPDNTKTPRATLDDKRFLQSNSSDIILGYILNNNLYMRRQRDRFGVVYLLYESVNGLLSKLGMTDKNRLQFRLQSNLT